MIHAQADQEKRLTGEGTLIKMPKRFLLTRDNSASF